MGVLAAELKEKSGVTKWQAICRKNLFSAGQFMEVADYHLFPLFFFKCISFSL